MNDINYKKTYKGFIIWLVVFTLGITGIGFLPFAGLSVDLMTRLMDCLTLVGCTILMFIIYKKETVYWYSGITYEQALKAGSARRKVYALKHFRLFGIYTIVFTVFTIIMQLIGAPMMVDVVVLVVSIFAVSVRTMFYKL